MNESPSFELGVDVYHTCEQLAAAIVRRRQTIATVKLMISRINDKLKQTRGLVAEKTESRDYAFDTFSRNLKKLETVRRKKFKFQSELEIEKSEHQRAKLQHDLEMSEENFAKLVKGTEFDIIDEISEVEEKEEDSIVENELEEKMSSEEVVETDAKMETDTKVESTMEKPPDTMVTETASDSCSLKRREDLNSEVDIAVSELGDKTSLNEEVVNMSSFSQELPMEEDKSKKLHDDRDIVEDWVSLPVTDGVSELSEDNAHSLQHGSIRNIAHGDDTEAVRVKLYGMPQVEVTLPTVTPPPGIDISLLK